MNTKTTVLVAEDSRTQAVRFQLLLEKAGFQVVLAADGKQAMEMIRETRPDVVVTDLDMPEMNGLELVEAVHLEFPGIPIILATAVGSETIAAEALRKGAASYVPKRFLNDLVPTLQQLLAVAQADRASSLLAAYATYSEVQFSLTNETALLAPLIAQLQRMLERFGLLDGNGAMRVASALDEAMQNAIIHGNLEVSSKLREEEDVGAYHAVIQKRRQELPFKDRRAHIRARVTRDQAEFVIRDEGPGFDPRSIPDPTDPAFLDRPCGRGLWLINAFMAEVHYNEKGNEITMIYRKPVEE